MTSAATSVADYLAELSDDRREAIEAVRQVILKNLPKGIEEQMQYGMIGYAVPHSRYPFGYHCDPKQPLPFAGLASQKNHMAVYLFCIYTDESACQTFVKDAQAEGKKLDMGKGCIRFKKLSDFPLDALAKVLKSVTLEEFIAHYESGLPEKIRAKREKARK
ncbi:MAG: DUF1801 domain-containing protein [Fimbriimonadaceae bacterium]